MSIRGGNPNSGGGWTHGERTFRSSLTSGERADYDKVKPPQGKNPLEEFSTEELEAELARRKSSD